MSRRATPRFTIALDYDDTYTRCPLFWQSVLRIASLFNIAIVVVTAREPRPANRQLLAAAFQPILPRIIFANHQAKQVAAQAAGLKIDVWIDDTPAAITTPEAAAAWWRQQQVMN